MRTPRALGLAAAFCAALVCASPAGAGETVTVCFNYGCLAQADVSFSDAQLAEVARSLAAANSPGEEREALGKAVGRLLGWAGEQSPIAADRGGNYADDNVYGRMDCIDHATTTTRLLRLLERRGALRFHRVLEPALRYRMLLFQHYSALIEEKIAGRPATETNAADAEPEERPVRFVVDSWFFDNGHPAAVMPLADWLRGETPDDDR
ncbi:MAG: hypothetical protein LBS70_01030 [Candidatus Accumulibacter sp.]|jgi:hypothetical protein|nr:hypothetical protein [Accumulibacter sp.]